MLVVITTLSLYFHLFLNEHVFLLKDDNNLLLLASFSGLSGGTSVP
jgi:hypothetical protein